MVYHYTTIEALYSILANYKAKDNKDYFVFWASNIHDLNDYKEMSLSMEDIMPIIIEIEKKNNWSNDFRRLSTVLEHSVFINRFPEEVKELIDNQSKIVNNAPYTISFSTEEDILTMWSMYAKNGTGVCLSFNEQELQCQNSGVFPLCDTVFYEKKKEYYYGIIEQIYDNYMKSVKDENIINIIEYRKLGIWTSILLPISPFIKDRGFKEEAEWRMAFYTNVSDNPPKCYSRITTNLNVIRYILINIPVCALKRITIGPCANYIKTRELICKEMEECGIPQIKDPLFIRESSIPYRIY